MARRHAQAPARWRRASDGAARLTHAPQCARPRLHRPGKGTLAANPGVPRPGRSRSEFVQHLGSLTFKLLLGDKPGAKRLFEISESVAH